MGKRAKDGPFRRFMNKFKIHLIHNFLGYGLMISSQLAIISGVKRYNIDTGNYTIGYVGLGIYFGLWSIFELFFQIKTRVIDESSIDLHPITVHHFH